MDWLVRKKHSDMDVFVTSYFIKVMVTFRKALDVSFNVFEVLIVTWGCNSYLNFNINTFSLSCSRAIARTFGTRSTNRKIESAGCVRGCGSEPCGCVHKDSQ